jgi:large subunit ribosomal protein L18
VSKKKETGVLRKEKEEARRKRKRRVSAKVRGNAEHPRLCVFKSSRHIYAQLIDDLRGQTLVAASSQDPELKGIEKGEKKIATARRVGALIATKALAKQVRKVVFDRNGFLYHGRVKALADAAREQGLDF